MTYRRPTHGFCTALTDLCRGLGPARLAEALGTSPDWLAKCANPMSGRHLSVEYAVRADIAAARAGLGTPHFSEFHRRLIAAGTFDGRSAAVAPFPAPVRTAIRAAVETILRLLDGPASAEAAA